MTNVVEILITAKDLASPAMARVNAQVNGVSKGMAAFHKTALIGAAGLTAIGVESVKMATKFDASMTLLHTQAGVAQDKMAGLKKGVLDLAGKVGQDPDSLAESLYHVESNFESVGISSKKALDLVATAAKGATTGHADLVDVTNALTAAVASGIPGVENFDKAMGVLNATVGTGDMKMQDLANAFGSGMVATVAGFGLSIKDVGAALATFGDNNIRGSLAGNQLRMSVMALAKPVATAHDALAKLGLQQDTLAKDMQKGGLKLAMEDLVGHMKKAGITSEEQGQIITDAFGRKAGAGLNVLVREFDKFESKYPALTAGANKFGDAWADTQKTFAFQMKALQASFDALMISLGTKLIPPLQSFVSLLLAHKSATIGVTAALAGLLAATVAVSAAMKVAAAMSMLWSGAGKAVAALRGVFETVALKALYMREAFVSAGGGVRGLGAAFSTLSTGAKLGVTVAAIGALVMALHELAGYDKAPIDIDRLTTSLGELGRTGKVTGELKANLTDLADSIAIVSKGASDNKLATWITDFGTWTGIAKGPGISRAKENVDAVDKSLASLVQNGHADTAAAAALRLQKAWVAGGGTVKRFNSTMNDYQAALAGVSLNEQLSADQMGLFGSAAVSTQKSLDAEAESAKGLEESIMALNQVHRDAYDAETAFYQAISDATKAIKDNGRTLNVHTDAGRKNRDVLSQLAAKTEDLVDKKVKEKASWESVDRIYKQGRQSLIDTAMAMGDTKKQAQALADEILKAPDAKKFKFKVDDKQAVTDLTAFNAAVKKSPHAKSVTLTTLSKTAEQVLEAFGFKVQHLKNGGVKISASTGAALSAIRNVQNAVNNLHNKNVGIGVYTTHYYKSVMEGGVHSGPQLPGMPGSAHGGLVRGYADGGDVQAAPTGLIRGPGSGTSDSILAMFASGAVGRISNTEFVVNAASTRKYLPLLEAINRGRLKVAGFARGGVTKAEAEARKSAYSDLTITQFGREAGYKRSEFQHAVAVPGSIDSLVDSLNHYRGVIKASTHGSTESRLIKQYYSAANSLIKWEKQLNSVTKALSSAKDKLSSLKDAASQLSSSVKSSLISSANITKNSSEGPVTLASVRSGFTASRDKVTAFAAALKKLKAKGFSASIIQQVAEAGIDGGGLETAGALLQASSADVKSFNSMQSQISTAAGSAGKTTADAVYEKQIAAQEKYVKALESQQKKLQSSMDKLAASIQKAVLKAIGHKAAGGVVGMAAAGGLRSSLTWVGEQGPELLDLPAGSRVFSNPDSRRMLAQARTPWESMLTSPRRASAGAGTAVPAPSQPIVLNVSLAGREFGQIWVDVGRKEVKTRGGLKATLGDN